VKKSISIAIALALLALVVLPVGVAAQGCDPADPYYDQLPDTYAKIPFAIIETGLLLIGDIVGALPPEMGIPDWIPTITDTIAPWAGGPLSWTVDMLGWGLGIVATILNDPDIGSALGLPAFVGPLVSSLVCSIFTPFDCVIGDPWLPCA
jgi:hypothetical protein